MRPKDTHFEDFKAFLAAARVFVFCGTCLCAVSIRGECCRSLLSGRQEKQLRRSATGSAVAGGVPASRFGLIVR